MKTMTGWRCAHCHAVTLEFRFQRPPACPHCKDCAWDQDVTVFKLTERDLWNLLEPTTEGN